jgi:hypothetical protein
MKTLLLAAAAFVMLASTHSKASLLIEPLIGYNLASKISDENGGGGRAFGGRLGYQNLGLQLGVDYLNSTMEIDDVKDFAVNDYAAFVGYKFPILLRIYAGYIFSSAGEGTVASVKRKYEEGSGQKFGMSFTGIPFVNINFEYRTLTYDKVGGSAPTGNGGDFQSYLVSLSLPLNF